MGGIDEIDDPNVGFGGMLPMQPARVLPQRSFPRHRHGQINVSSGGWSKPSPTSRPVASRIRGESGGSALISVTRFARCFFEMRPCSTKGSRLCSSSERLMLSRWSVRSVSTSTLRPSSTVRLVSSAIAAVRSWSSARVRNMS